MVEKPIVVETQVFKAYRIDPSLFECSPPPEFPSGEFLQGDFGGATEMLAAAYSDCREKLKRVHATVQRQICMIEESCQD